MKISSDKIQLKRHFSQNAEQLYAAWFDPNADKSWFCPENCVVSSAKANAQVGGTYRMAMKCGDATHTAYGTYREIIPNQKIVFTHSWEERDSVQTQVTVEFREKNGGADLTLTQTGFIDPVEADGHDQGWSSTLENLAKHLGLEKAA